MTVPSITSLTPSSGPTGGSILVEVAGGGFRMPAPPSATGRPVPEPPPTVRVVIGGRVARDVSVFREDQLTCMLPAGDAGLADVVVENLDDDGAVIPGEQAFAPDAFRYILPPLTPESDLTRLVRTLLQEMKRQVMANVVLTVQTDFDDETGGELHLTQIAELPGLVLVGPELAENRFYSLNQLPEQATSPRSFVRRRVPYTVDLGFTLVGVSDHTAELLNLMAVTQLFFHRNKFLEMQRDLADPATGVVRYEMDLTRDGDLRVTSQPNESNVRSFSGRFVVRGFDLEGLAGVPDDGLVERGAVVESIVLQPSEQTGPLGAVGRHADP
jgi:IPT/TIG domain-containing protein